MTLEDFFTLSELKDGLTNPDRVKELITVMQSEKDSMVNRQWSMVATAIASTENKNCLDLFIYLDGPSFINKWLKDSQKLLEDNENGVVEELIIALLKALERLQIDKETLVDFEIVKLVQDIGANSSSKTVREKSKLLCDSWMLNQDKNNETPNDVENLESFSGDNTETGPPSDKIMDSVTMIQKVLVRAEPSCKSTVDSECNIVNKSEVPNNKSETVEESDVKDEKKINIRDQIDSIELSTLEQIALNADVDNPLQPSITNTDVLSDKDEEMVDNGESPNSEANGGIQINGSSENGSRFFKLSLNSKKSDMELDYGMIDPLDIARQVANEVEREVDSRERSCSTSEKISGGENDKKSRKSTADSKQSQTPLVAESNKEISVPEPVKDAETLVSQISEVAQESEPDTGRRFSGFDLNQDVCSEEVDNSVNPVSGTHKNLKQLSGFLDFDLNVADVSEDKMVIISGVPSVEESSVANPTERPQLDLNSIGDDQNAWQSPSRSSSSSSKLPIKRNIDLNFNDQHSFSNDTSLDHSVISIFGKKVHVKEKDPFSEPKVEFGSGRRLEPSVHYGNPNPYSNHNINPNPNPSFYGHHNGMFFSMPLYGASHSTQMQMPYMVDSRGATFVPQVMPTQQPSPFIMNMIAPGPLHLQQNVDLNTGLMINGENRKINGLRQFFPQNVDERYFRPNNSLQASSSSNGGVKRLEPDSRFDFFPVNKHQQPPPWR
ncbi:uncharacterized protein [Rutidosis leptorrhynchoides]|uniref:uncharacterized protein n=1 Tax=Rutidosis leptorrhynchoides TaxID=125765 RepID=UPI003A9A20AB